MLAPLVQSHRAEHLNPAQSVNQCVLEIAIKPLKHARTAGVQTSKMQSATDFKPHPSQS